MQQTNNSATVDLLLSELRLVKKLVVSAEGSNRPEVGCLWILSHSKHLDLLSELDGEQLTRGRDLCNEEILL